LLLPHCCCWFVVVGVVIGRCWLICCWVWFVATVAKWPMYSILFEVLLMIFWLCVDCCVVVLLLLMWWGDHCWRYSHCCWVTLLLLVLTDADILLIVVDVVMPCGHSDCCYCWFLDQFWKVIDCVFWPLLMTYRDIEVTDDDNCIV